MTDRKVEIDLFHEWRCDDCGEYMNSPIPLKKGDVDHLCKPSLKDTAKWKPMKPVLRKGGA